MFNTTGYKIIIGLLILVMITISWYLFDTIKEYKYSNEIYQEQTLIQILRMSSSVSGADINLAKTLVSVDSEEQFSSILNTLKYTALVNRNNINTQLGSSSFSYINFWNKTEQYLDYLLTKNELLNNVERENLKIVRQHLEIIIPTFKKLKEIAREKNWVKYFHHDEQVRKIFSDMGVELERLSNVGENDERYKQSKYSYTGYYPRDIFKEEKENTEEKLSQLVKKFMGKLWDDDINVTTGGEGFDPIWGTYKSFNGFRNGRLLGSYEVKISERGGHILSAGSIDDFEFERDFKQEEDNILGKMTREETINYAKNLIKRWNEESLELYNIKEWDQNLIMTFVPKRKNISLLNRKVEIVVNPTIGKLIRFNADDYFMYYRKEAPSERKLSEEEVINILGDKVEMTDSPSLEVIRGKTGSDVLVYSVTVEGVDKVNKIFINAINGKNEGIVYNEYGLLN